MTALKKNNFFIYSPSLLRLIKSTKSVMTMNRYNFFLISALLCTYLIAWKVQSSFLLNWDNSWCMHAAERLLAGGTYINDFFDVNLPLTLYLYAPPHFLVNFFHISITLAFRVYIFTLASLSLALCYFFIWKIFSKENSLLAAIFTCMIAILLLILPQYHFGQREHLFLIFTLPYFLFASLRLGNYTLKPFYIILLSIYAGIGFVIKPYFLCSFGLITLYRALHSRQWLSLFRLETITIALFVLIYIFFIFIYYPSFIYTIAPLSAKYFYSKGYAVDPLPMVLFNGATLFCFLTMIFFVLQYKENTYKELSNILGLALIGSLFSYVIQRNAWPYHYLPAMSIALLLNILLFGLFFKRNHKNLSEWIFTSFLGFLIFYCPVNFAVYNYQQGTMLKELLEPLILFMNHYTKNKTAYFLTTNIYHTTPAIDYSDTILASRFAHLPMIPGFFLTLKHNKKPYSQNIINDENFLIHLMVDDLGTNKPDFVFIDTAYYKNFSFINFEFLPYLSKNENFRNIWKNYRYFTTLEQPNIITKKLTILFYLFDDIKSIDIKEITQKHFFTDKIVLTGKDDHRTAYLMHGDRIMRKTNLILQDSEYQFLEKQKQGLVEINNENKNILENLELRITKAAYPFFKIDVYQRINEVIETQ